MAEDFANIVLSADTKKLIKAIEDLRKLGAAGGDTEKRLKKAMDALEAVSTNFNANMTKAAQAYAASLKTKVADESKAQAASLKQQQEAARKAAAIEKAALMETQKNARLAAQAKAAEEKAALMATQKAARLAAQAKLEEERKVAAELKASQKAQEKATRDAMKAEEQRVRQFNRLSAELDPAIAAAQRYNTILRSLNESVRNGLVPQEEANRLMEIAARDFRVAEEANNLFHTSFSRSMGGFSRVARANITQFAYQIQDVGIQLQAGQNAMIIFAQQGSQIASLFGAEGAIVGAIIGFSGAIASVLLPSLMSTNTYMDDLRDATSALKSSISDLSATASQSLEVIADKYGIIDEKLVRLIEHQKQQQEGAAQRDLLVVLDTLQEKYGTLMETAKQQSKAGAFAMQDLTEQLGLTKGEVVNLIQAWDELKNASTPKEQYEALVKIDDLLQKSTESTTEFGSSVTDAALSMKELQKATGDAKWFMSELVAGRPLKGWLEGAIQDATTLGTRLWNAATAFTAMVAKNRPASKEQIAGGYNLYGSTRQQSEEALHATVEATKAAYQLYGATRQIAAGWYVAEDAASGAGGAATEAMTDAEKAIKAAEEAAKSYADTMSGYVTSGIETVVSNMVDGFKGGLKGIWTVFINTIKQMIVFAAMNRIKIGMGLSPLAGSTALASAASGATSGSGSGWMSGMLSGAGGAVSGFTTGLTDVATGLFTSGLGGAGSAITSALAGVSGGGLAGLATAAGALALPIAALAAAFSLLRIRTKKLDEGLVVTADGMNTTVESFERVKRKFLWNSWTKTTHGSVGSEISDPIGAAVGSMEKAIIVAARTLGIGQRAFRDFAYELKVSTKGMTDAEATKAVQDAIGKLGDSFALMIPHLKRYIHEGETATEALMRLNTAMSAVKSIAHTLGLEFTMTGLRGANAASKLVDAFGGLDAMNSATSTYYETFYSESERMRIASRDAARALRQIGLTMPNTREQYRHMVDSLNLNTAAGRKAFAVLTSLASVMDFILPKVDDTTGAVDNLGNAFDKLVAKLRKSVNKQISDILGPTKKAYNDAVNKARDWRSATKSIQDFIAGMLGKVSELTGPYAALSFNRGQFNQAVRSARNGNVNAASRLPELAANLIESVSQTSHTAAEAAVEQAKILAGMQGVSDYGNSVAAQQEAQAALLKKQIDALEAIKAYDGTNVKTLEQMLARLDSVNDAIVAQGGASTNSLENQIMELIYALQGKTRTNNGDHRPRPNSAVVGQDNPVASEVRGLRSEIASLRDEQAQINGKTMIDIKQMRKIFEDWQANGMPAVRA